MQNPVYTYSFETSQPLTQEQVDYLSEILMMGLIPSAGGDFGDIPEWTTEVKLTNVEQLLD